ncbi:hypothetical protein FRACYDRAFT_236531 [Fragilariopsis cylindrus CCMP1102]|uniref:Uncharacterized protein n=1 Tax=Fragilariopsis cylindrus CCMP1102 TaxID=635003 RepID=A0A1E7FJD1_9STRA|nr:hypothetical protein FRACYDRAFT_236531 [Fragilariopsis cylindrus CCMP1102]|eukprot:OEU18258.1 hypothetical protein FRACYDRAFT_236531 [Fragilariopsis cylindrus CCMP1102]
MNNSAFSNEYCHDYMSLYYGGQTETVSHQQNQPSERDESLSVIKEKKEERIAPESIPSSSSSTNDYTSSGIAKRPLPNNNNAKEECVDNRSDTSPTNKRARLMMMKTTLPSSSSEGETKAEPQGNNTLPSIAVQRSESATSIGSNSSSNSNNSSSINIHKYPPGISHAEKARLRAKKSYQRKIIRLKELPIAVQEQKRIKYNAGRKAKAEKKRELQIGFLKGMRPCHRDNGDGDNDGNGNSNNNSGADNGVDDESLCKSWKCRGCNQTCKSELGLIQHIKRTCKVYKKWKETKLNNGSRQQMLQAAVADAVAEASYQNHNYDSSIANINTNTNNTGFASVRSGGLAATIAAALDERGISYGNNNMNSNLNHHHYVNHHNDNYNNYNTAAAALYLHQQQQQQQREIQHHQYHQHQHQLQQQVVDRHRRLVLLQQQQQQQEKDYMSMGLTTIPTPIPPPPLSTKSLSAAGNTIASSSMTSPPIMPSMARAAASSASSRYSLDSMSSILLATPTLGGSSSMLQLEYDNHREQNLNQQQHQHQQQQQQQLRFGERRRNVTTNNS